MRPGPIDWSQAAIGGATGGGEPLLPQGGGACSCMKAALSEGTVGVSLNGQKAGHGPGSSPRGGRFSEDPPAKGSKPRPQSGGGSAAQQFRQSDYTIQSIPDVSEAGCDWVWDIHRPDYDGIADASTYPCAPHVGPLGSTGWGRMVTEEMSYSAPNFEQGSATLPRFHEAEDDSALYYTYTEPPEALRALWPEVAWPWHDPSCTWVYISVGRTDGAIVNGNIAGSCAPPNEVAPLISSESNDVDGDTFVVSGMMPYAVCEVLSRAEHDDTSSPRTAYRIRYWVGFIHHFSFFIPMHGSDPNSITDIPATVWSANSGRVDMPGPRVEWYLGLISGLTTKVAWSEDDSNVLQFRSSSWKCSTMHSGSYPPDPRITYATDQAGNETQSNGTSSTSPDCFSNPNAYNNGWMSSLLGQVVMGEICVSIPRDSYMTVEDAKEEGFETLFGSKVRMAMEIRYIGPDGAAYGTDEFQRAKPFWVTLRGCVTAADLETADSLSSRVTALRTSQHGRWLYRSFDAERLVDALNNLDRQPCEEHCSD